MNEIRPLTEKQALRAYKQVCAQLHEKPVEQVFEQGSEDWPDGPVLVRDYASWNTRSDWAVVWEGGDFEWALKVCWTMNEVHARTVFTEPIQSFSLGLYRPF